MGRQKAKEDEARRKALEDERRKLKKLEEEKEAEYQRQKDAAERERQKKKKEEEARRKELEEEKEAEMERQRKKNNHEWDVNCKGNEIKVNGQIANGSRNKSRTIWVKGVVSEGTHQWKFKMIDNCYNVCIGITNEKNEKKKNSYLYTLCYHPYSGSFRDADGKLTETNGKAKNNDIVSMKLDLKKKQLMFLLNGKQIGNAMTVKNGSYRAAVSLYSPYDSIKLL